MCCVCNHSQSDSPQGVKKMNIGIGTRPPNDLELFNFSGDFRAAQTLTFDFLRLPIQ